MSFSSPSQPDPIATASAQANMNHVDQYTPYGSLKYTQESTNPDGTPHYRSDISMTPSGQATFDQQQAQDQQVNNIANGYMGRIQNTMGQGLDMSQLPQMQSYADGGGIGVSTNVTPGSLQNSISSGNIQSGLDYSGTQAIPGGGDFSQDAQNYQDAYNVRMQPQLQRESNALDAKLANQGIMPGSEAYNTEHTLFGQHQNDANAQGVMGGYQTQQALNAQQLAAHQAGTTDVNNQGAFANNAQQQGYDQNLGKANLFNLAQGQQFDQGQQNAALRNSAQNQKFAQNTSNAQLANQARAQSLAEQLQQRELPLNEFNALRSASQVQSPTFSPTPNNSDLSQGIQNNYNQQVGQYNNTMSGLFSLGGSAIKASDIRLKHDIKRIGKTPRGLGVYEFKYKGKKKKHTGVMAQEVQKVIPEAIVMRPDGYMMVNYVLVR